MVLSPSYIQAASTLPFRYYLFCNLVRRDSALFMHPLFSMGLFCALAFLLKTAPLTCDSYCTITVIVSLTMNIKT